MCVGCVFVLLLFFFVLFVCLFVCLFFFQMWALCKFAIVHENE